MALPTSGPLSLDDIAGEFGGTVPHSLSEYYGVAAGIPTSGTITIADFYGAAAGAGLAFVASRSLNRVVSFDISDPANISELGSTSNGTYLSNVNRLAYDVDRAILYTGSTYGTNSYVTAWDVSSPATLSFLGIYILPHYPYCYDIKLDTVNQVMYIGTLSGSGYGQVESIDVSNPASMSRLSFVNGNTTPYFLEPTLAIDLDRSLIVVGTSTWGCIVNISNPSNLTFYTTSSFLVQTASPTVGYVDTAQEVAYFNASNSRIYPIDYSTPSSPTALPLYAVGDVRGSFALDPSKDELYTPIYTTSTVRVHDSSNPSSMSLLGTITDTTNLYRPFGSAIDTKGSVFYVVNVTNNNIASVDVSTPSTPTVLDSLVSANFSNPNYVVVG